MRCRIGIKNVSRRQSRGIHFFIFSLYPGQPQQWNQHRYHEEFILHSWWRSFSYHSALSWNGCSYYHHRLTVLSVTKFLREVFTPYEAFKKFDVCHASTRVLPIRRRASGRWYVLHIFSMLMHIKRVKWNFRWKDSIVYEWYLIPTTDRTWRQ